MTHLLFVFLGFQLRIYLFGWIQSSHTGSQTYIYSSHYAGLNEEKCETVKEMFNNSSFFFSGSMGNFDAIVFHIRDMDNGHIPMPNQKRRRPNQRYVMFLMESPLNDMFPYEKFGDFFNW